MHVPLWVSTKFLTQTPSSSLFLWLLYLLYLRCPHSPPPQGDVSQLDHEVWALFSNFSRGRAGSSSSSSSSSSQFASSSRVPSSSSSSSSSASSSSSQWSLRNLSPPSPPSGISSSVRPTRLQPYSPGHAPRLQVRCVAWLREIYVSGFFWSMRFSVLLTCLCFSLGSGSAACEQSKNRVSKTSASASGDGGKVDCGMTDWLIDSLTSRLRPWHIHAGKCHSVSDKIALKVN